MSGDADLEFECDLAEPPEKVWRALAHPQLREAWLGEPEIGSARVVRSEPGSRLDLAWPTRDGESEISFEVARNADGGAHLTITHRAPARLAEVALFAPRARRPALAAHGWRMAA
ncbi:MAG TPA: hypothetical protein VMU93_14170 [Caulobacteraceae bacterium]|nr:hypothetical protein [Caulobacteraceae bacterium]